MLIVDWTIHPVLERSREEWLTLWGFIQVDGRWYHPHADREALSAIERKDENGNAV